MHGGATARQIGQQEIPLDLFGLIPSLPAEAAQIPWCPWARDDRPRALPAPVLDRRRAALRARGVPADVGFWTKPALATGMICRALNAGVPARWVAGDEV
jgi:hypothetical protein